MQRTIYIFVNGILTFPGDSRNWTGRAVTHCITNGILAEKFEYLSGPGLTRSAFQRNRAAAFARMLSFYEDWNLHLIGHSNGADVILDALAMRGWPRLSSLHLFSPACDEDCDKSGLNSVRTAATFIYIAEKDWALRLGGSPVGRFFGFGRLGLAGPVNYHSPAPYHILRKPNYGHDTWFDSIAWEETMARILG
jgi:pimeloyl-ACP methyl ester carboxylesterase